MSEPRVSGPDLPSADPDDALPPRGPQSIAVRGPLAGEGAAAERILRALPAWFGIEESLVAYARAADAGPTFVAQVAGAPAGEAADPRRADAAATVGFVTLRATSDCAVELHVMAVLPGWHRHGVGRALVEASAAHVRSEGFELLHVKTLAASDPDPGYAATRAFYLSLGFRPLEVLPQVWGPENPCLLLVRGL